MDVYYYLVRQRWFPTRPTTIVSLLLLGFLAGMLMRGVGVWRHVRWAGWRCS